MIAGYRRSDALRVAIKRISKSGTSRWGWLAGKVVPLELTLLCQVNEVRRPFFFLSRVSGKFCCGEARGTS